MQELLKKELSSTDILELCDHKTRLLKYDDLVGFENIDELLSPHNACVLLYQAGDYHGHWVVLTRRRCNDTGEWVIEFFDPYGYEIDEEIDLLPERSGAQSIPYLTWLLLNSGYDRVVIQDEPLQSTKSGINTCGRWAALRVIYKDVPLHKFIDFFLQAGHPSPDEFAVMLTEGRISVAPIACRHGREGVGIKI